MSPPLVSVVVPVRDVERYLPACLDSILAQTWSNLEILCVDEGSADRTPEVLRTYAELDRRVRVLPAPGQEHARDAGLAQAGGQFVGFARGDDALPPTAIARLAGSLAHTGSDLATGRVLRTSGTRSWPSVLHDRSHPRQRLGTHVSRTPSLLHDTTAWNQLYRRDFWDSQRLSFPAGRLFEDIPVTMRAHVLARSVDVVTDVVYHWRRLEDGSRSITQRRYEVRNLADRVAGLTDVRRFLTDQAVPRLRDLHDLKALECDLDLYLREFLDAEEGWRRRFVELAGGFAASAPEQVLRGLSPALRAKYHLAAGGDAAGLAGLLEHERAHGGRLPAVRVGLAARLDTGPARVPRRLTSLRRELPLRAGVDRVHWRNGKLVLEGYAFLEHVPAGRFATLRRLRFTDRRAGRSFSVLLLPRADPRVVAAHGAPGLSYRQAGFRAVVPARRLAPPGSGGASWEVTVEVSTPYGRAAGPLGPPRAGAAWFTAPHLVRTGRDGVVHTAHWTGRGWLTLRATAFTAFLTGAELDADGRRARLVLSSPDTGAEPPQSVLLRSRTGTASVELPIDGVTTDPGTGSRIAVTVPFDDLAAAGRAPRESWRMSVRTATRDLAVGAGEPETLVGRTGEGTAQLWPDVRGRAGVLASGARVLVEGAEWRGRLLRISGTATLPAGALPGLAWTSARGDRMDAEEARHGDRFQSVVDLGVMPGPGGPRPLPAGRWTLTRRGPDGRAEQVTVARGLQPEVERTGAAGPGGVRLRVDGRSVLSMSVHAVAEDERGRYHQDRLRSVRYPAARKRPRADVILLESWHGKEFSDNPGALAAEALRRRAAGADWPELVVSTRDDSVAVPEGVRAVRRWSREWYETLGTARLVVSNDSMFPGFVKRPDQTYLQTWHGTPLKRIGFDIDRIHFRNRAYLADLAREVATWDWLVSPNRHTTGVLRTAFRYEGEILETGYPRNDLLVRPEAAAERERVRAALGIEPGTQVALWMPTWRDNQFDPGSGYAFPPALDPAQVEKQLGPGHVILCRGHHLVADTVGDLSSPGGTFVNVSGHPDVRELYLAADVLVTDYSSAMFDFALTGRPILLLAWDLEDFRDVLRGFYLDYEAVAPGPILRTGHDLTEALLDLPTVARNHSETLNTFRRRFCALEDGHAAARIWDRLEGRF